LTRRQWIAPDWSARLAAAGLVDLAVLLDAAPATLPLAGRWCELSKPGLGGRQRWRWELPGGPGGGATLFLKRYGRSGLREQWDRIFHQSRRHSRAWWEAQQCRRLREAHTPAPEVVGVAESLRGPLERRSVLLLAAAPGDAFDRVWPRACREGAAITHGPARHEVIVRLAHFIAAFHQSGGCHRDLYLCHVFVALDPQAARPPAFMLIDLARVLRPRWRRLRWRIKDLAQLDSSAREIGAARTDRLRFLQAYLGLQPGAPRARWYAHRIVRKSNWILRRIARRSRP
jgi:heptose I phosphotransferase